MSWPEAFVWAVCLVSTAMVVAWIFAKGAEAATKSSPAPPPSPPPSPDAFDSRSAMAKILRDVLGQSMPPVVQPKPEVQIRHESNENVPSPQVEQGPGFIRIKWPDRSVTVSSPGLRAKGKS